MEGLASTKMGGMPSPQNPTQSRYRYYRVVFQPNVSGTGLYLSKYSTTNTRTYEMRHLFFNDRVGGPNLIEDLSVGVEHSHVSASTMATLRSAYAATTDYYVDQRVPVSDLVASSITIDMGRQIQLNAYALCVVHAKFGWRLEGSANGTDWSLMHTVTGHSLFSQYGVKTPYLTGIHTGDRIGRWVGASFNPKSAYRVPHKYWGFYVAEATDDTTYYSAMEFRDGVGGTDLISGGEVVLTPSPNEYYSDIDYLVDGNLNNAQYCYTGSAFGYKFPSPVLPVTMAIGSGDSSSQATKLVAISSDDGFLWGVEKIIETPHMTWPQYSYAIEEFIL